MRTLLAAPFTGVRTMLFLLHYARLLRYLSLGIVLAYALQTWL